MMCKWIFTLVFLITNLFLSCFSDREEDFWDYKSEIGSGSPIRDLSGVSIGITVNSAGENAIVDSLKIRVNIEHEKPSNLIIKLYRNDDSIVAWGNNYLGGSQEYSTNYFNGKNANGNWGIMVYDSVADGNEGYLNGFTLMIKYKTK